MNNTDNIKKTTRVGITNFIDNGKIGMAFKSEEIIYSSYGIEIDLYSNSKTLSIEQGANKKENIKTKFEGNGISEVKSAPKDLYMFHYLLGNDIAIGFYFEGVCVKTPFKHISNNNSFIKKIFRKFVSFTRPIKNNVYSAIDGQQHNSSNAFIHVITHFVNIINGIHDENFQNMIDAADKTHPIDLNFKKISCTCMKKRIIGKETFDLFISDEINSLIESIISKRNETYRVNKLITAKRTYLSHEDIIKSIEKMLGMTCEHIRAYFTVTKYEEIFYKFIISTFKFSDLMEITVEGFDYPPEKLEIDTKTIFKLNSDTFKEIISDWNSRYSKSNLK